jgi:hypothetical protein
MIDLRMVHQNGFFGELEKFFRREYSVGGSGKRGRFQGVLMELYKARVLSMSSASVPIANILPGRFKSSLCSSVRRHLDCVYDGSVFDRLVFSCRSTESLSHDLRTEYHNSSSAFHKLSSIRQRGSAANFRSTESPSRIKKTQTAC